MLLREATSETYGPWVYSHHINLHHFYIVLLFTLLLLFYFAHLYQKYQKYYLSSLSDLTLVSDREGIDNPLSRWLRVAIVLCRYEGLERGHLLD